MLLDDSRTSRSSLRQLLEQAANESNYYHPPKLVDGELAFDVFALGTRGAGKTVFLSALYQQLATQDNTTNSFFVELQREPQRRFLVKTYAQAADPDAEWPPGSATINEYEFRCQYFSAGKTIPLFRFNYFDYPGGFLTEDMDGPDSFNVGEATQRAHAILVLIDGQKILQSIEDLEVRGPNLNADLNTMIPFLQKCAHRPVQFIVTKWDVLQGIHSLMRVRDELMKNENFRKFVAQRISQRLPVHLIPVSALGSGFAVFDRAERRMKKIPGGRIQPYNVELSIGMALTDHLLLLSQHPHFKRDSKPLKLLLLKFLGKFVRSAEQTLSYFRLPFHIRTDRVLELLRTTSGTILVKQEDMQQEIQSTLQRISDQKSAVESILMIQAMRRNVFYAEFPESNLIAIRGPS